MFAKMLRRLFWLAVLVALGWGVYLYFFHKPAQRAPLSAIPKDAVFIAETDRPLSGFRQLQRTAIWQHLLGHPWFAETHAELHSLDSLIQANAQLAALVDGRPITLSVHQTAPDDFDLLYLADLKEASGVAVLDEVLYPLLASLYSNVSRQSYQDITILKVYDPEDKQTLSIAILGNLLAMSYTPKLVYAAIDQQRNPYFDTLANMEQLRTQTVGGGLLACYVHHAYLSKFMAMFGPVEAATQRLLSELLDLTGLQLEVQHEEIHLRGYTYVHDSLPGYFVDILASGNGALAAHKIVPNRIALYMGLQFADFLVFYERMMARLREQPDAVEYMELKDRMEKWFRIDIKQDFVSWVGGEIAVVQTLAADGKAVPAVVVHTRSIDDARAGMQRIERQVRRRSPAKFKMRHYKDYEIHYLHIKGFFKLFLGKLLNDFEYPYYTYIDDCIVFTLSEEALEAWIDDYERKNTLHTNKRFRHAQQTLSSTGNVFLFLDMHNFFPMMKQWLSPAQWLAWVDNEDWIRSFPTFGLWLGGEKQHFQSKLFLSFAPYVPEESVQAQARIEASQGALQADTAYTVYFASGSPREERAYLAGKLHGRYRSYYANGNTREMGRYHRGARVGVWYEYSRRGTLKDTHDYGDTPDDAKDDSSNEQ